ncbi:integrin beta-1-like isoform X1 [Acanthopagrus latus]|uniref:integrin beta-1-like isoform X1 n=2 Tax=Acanthopagrus latus TaxID=8177 RepID=UPI00187D0451|nr:integrin beta-1-like isoform X1 [Acanthopagrus latus]
MSPLLAAVLLLCRRYDATGTQDHSDHGCQSQGVRSCAECLAAGPHCAWCAEESFLELGQHIWERCDTARALLQRGCPSDRLEDPRGSTVLLKNQKITFHPKEQRRQQQRGQVTQLQPQTVLLNLRPGEAQSFEVKFKRVEDYPIDLYYLMDLSFSMEDDLPSVKKLGADLMEEMRNITSDFRMGFGAFVDKTVMPYISTAKDMLRNPCKRTEPWPCTPPFTYRHILSLTANGSLFTKLVGGQRISGNLDFPEGGLDALMQAAVCEKQIGWRNVTRLLVFSTDAGFHIAGDGKLGGIVIPNDGKCHLQKNVYTKGNSQDYPSVAHVAEILREKNIQIIFAVTEEVRHLYEGLRSVFPKCAVGTLSNNSHNILQIIVEAYNALTSEVVMENSKLPPGYHISYTSHCKDRKLRHGEHGRKCSNISIGDEVSFNVSITAPLCVPAAQRPPRVIIKPQGYSEEVEVLLSPICECSCQKDVVPHSPKCSHGNGTLECGTCRCKEGRVGALCECDRAESSEAFDSYLCRRDNASEVCSGRGECVCGKCVCRKSGKKPIHAYYGEFCECSDFSCDQYRGQQCGGHGRCVCGACKCYPEFHGQACECPLSSESCLSQDKQICSGRGDCHCGACICHDNRFQGPTCELCPSCPSMCTLHRECVLCTAFSLGLNPKECETRCVHLNLTLVGQAGVLARVPPSPGLHRCMEVDTEGCRVHFLLRTGQKDNVHVALERECPSGPNVILITAALSASVVVLGVALLLLWKLLTGIHDRREFARFQRELEQRRWNRRDNPIYRSAITTTVNPKYKEQ